MPVQEGQLTAEFSAFLPLSSDREKRWWHLFIDRLQDQTPIANFEIITRNNKEVGVWIHATKGEYCDLNKVAQTVHKFFRETNARNCFATTCAFTSSKNEIDHFTGSAVFVTADDIKWFNCSEWIKLQLAEFQKKEKAQLS